MSSRHPYRSRRAERRERDAKRAYERARAEARRLVYPRSILGQDARCALETAVGGACTKVRRRYLIPRPNPYRKARGKVREFSRRSRTRLQQTLCSIPISAVGRGMLFVTLTYPNAYPGDWAKWKTQLHHWRLVLFRKFPGAAFVWKLEPQTRGAPHFHLIVLGVPFMAHEWLARSWYDVVDSRPRSARSCR